MSTERGHKTKGPPAHQNRVAFHHNKNSKKTKVILSLPNEGLCNHCHEIIEWKKRYRKYKPLTVPSKCVSCNKKTVRRAYHTICDECSVEQKVCAKCRVSSDIVNQITTPEQRREEEMSLKLGLERMTLREKKSFYRQLEKTEKRGGSDDDEEDEEDQMLEKAKKEFEKEQKGLRKKLALEVPPQKPTQPQTQTQTQTPTHTQKKSLKLKQTEKEKGKDGDTKTTKHTQKGLDKTVIDKLFGSDDEEWEDDSDYNESDKDEDEDEDEEYEDVDEKETNAKSNGKKGGKVSEKSEKEKDDNEEKGVENENSKLEDKQDSAENDGDDDEDNDHFSEEEIVLFTSKK